MSKRVVVGRVTKQCEGCGQSVTRQASSFREHVFCSKRCYWASGYHAKTVSAANAIRHPVDTIIAKSCEQCGTEVRRHRSQYRNRTFCSATCRQTNRAMTAQPQLTSRGYVKIYVGRHVAGADSHGHILEHRKVMQEFLGRALVALENVHHKNGDRTDNRLENLELWTRSQPSGQRVEDKLAWAREFIAEYQDTPMI